MEDQAELQIRLLGELEVRAAGKALALPQSRKTRALLAYLVLTARPHRRERLCSLLWDVADDPRGALRWSLSKLRSLVDEPGTPRLAATRDTVAFEAGGARVDCALVRDALARGLGALSTERLEELARIYRGELLEGLDLPDFHEYQAWCAAEREQSRRERAAILRELVARLSPTPEAALPYARDLAHVDALEEQAHATLLGLLLAAGRGSEARQYHDSAKRVLTELGARSLSALDAVWRERSTLVSSAPERVATAVLPPASAEVEEPAPLSELAEAPPSLRSRLVGREAELEQLSRLLEDVSGSGKARALLVTGEPGIGKSRLARELLELGRRAGGTVLECRAFEVETTHPYAPWLDALRKLSRGAPAGSKECELAELLSRGAAHDREQLFSEASRVLAACADERPPLIFVLDDVQWCDEASTSLLHHVLRTRRDRPLCVVLTARSGELLDNLSLVKLLRGLRREHLLTELTLGPLTREAVMALSSQVAPAADAAAVYERSAGNPLFALALSQAWAERGGAELPETLAELVRDRLSRLPPVPMDLLRWAAIAGGSFDARSLAATVSLGPDELVSALETLERHQILAAEPDGTYAFTHELLRSVVYGDISGPRRKLMHLSIARTLEPRAEDDGKVAADLAHHAALGGDASLAARACVRAGRRCLRLFANAEAGALARRGRVHADTLPEHERVPLLLELSQVSYGARRPDQPALAAKELQALAERALDLGHLAHARLAFHLLSYLRWEGGAWSDAERYALEAERVSRSSDEGERMVALAEAGRCLSMLERELGQAEALLLEAQALSRRLGREPGAVADAFGLLRQHEGRLDEAEELFRRSRAVARAEGDRGSEFQALEHLLILELSRGRYAAVRDMSHELTELAGKLREGSEMPFAKALSALSALALGEPGAAGALSAALAELRAVDAKHRLAFALTRAAAIDLTRDPASALDRAREALAAARLLDLTSDTAFSLGLVAVACARLGDDEGARRARAELGRVDPRRMSATVRAWLSESLPSAAGEQPCA